MIPRGGGEVVMIPREVGGGVMIYLSEEEG